MVHRFATARNAGNVHVILFAVGVLAFAIGAVMFTIGAWLLALSKALLGKFMSAGMWVCVGVFMINAMSALVSAGEWHGMMPVYVGVMIVAVLATVANYWLRIRQSAGV